MKIGPLISIDTFFTHYFIIISIKRGGIPISRFLLLPASNNLALLSIENEWMDGWMDGLFRQDHLFEHSEGQCSRGESLHAGGGGED